MISAYNRDVSKRKALRKKRIARDIYHYWCNWNGEKRDYYDNLHQYSKNKIHCSCAYCSTKTRNKGSRRYNKRNYARAINYRKSDLIRQIAMDEQLRDEGFMTPRRRVKEWI